MSPKIWKKKFIIIVQIYVLFASFTFFHVWSVSLIIIIIIISYMVFLIGQFIFNIEYQRFVCSFVFFAFTRWKEKGEILSSTIDVVYKQIFWYLDSFISVDFGFFFAIVCFQCFLGLTSFIYLMIRFFFLRKSKRKYILMMVESNKNI